MAYWKRLLSSVYLLIVTNAAFAEEEKAAELPANTENEIEFSENDKPRIYNDYYGNRNYSYYGRPNFEYGYNREPNSYGGYGSPYQQYPGNIQSSYPKGYEIPQTTQFKPNLPIPIEGKRSFSTICGLTEPTCSCTDSPYRTFDGTCNNVNYGSRGAARSPLSRLLPARYKDGVMEVLKSTQSGRLPKPRVVSEVIFKNRDRPDPLNALSVMQWGQLVSHDVSLIRDRLDENEKPLKCCTDDGKMLPYGELDENCLPIDIPEDDPFYSKFYRRCMNMVRSQILDRSGCTSSDPIEQISVVTHFMDASFLYGSSAEENKKLRTFKGGQMITKEVYRPYERMGSRSFLPNVDEPTKVCDVKSDKDICYLAGDIRVNQNPFLSALHTLFLREHNRVAAALHDLNPNWSDDTIFQEARKIVIAQWQHNTYEYWLPRLIGDKVFDRFALHVSEKEFSTDYDKYVNPSTINEFTTAAYRFFHSTIQGFIDLDGEGRCPFKSIRLSDHFFRPSILEKEDNFDAILRGSVTQANQGADRYFTSEITKFLFRSSKPFGDDLESFDIQRGRDHGIPSYNDIRELCGLPKAVDFDDFLDVMTEENVYLLANLYRAVGDVDLFVGGTLEKLGVFGDTTATVGPTFGCLIAEQFLRWKRGDRYFFDLGGQAGSFTLDQLRAIDTANFSSILCDNLDYLKYVQEDAFLKIFPGNELRNCNKIPRLDLQPWKGYTPVVPACYQPLVP